MKVNLMVDVENMNVSANSALASIGVCEFSPEGIGECFYRTIDLRSCQQIGLEFDADTILWWMQQSEHARMELVNAEDRISQVLLDLNYWLRDHGFTNLFNDNPPIVWANGANADGVWIRNAYQKCGINPPWEFYQERCYRTMIHCRPWQHHPRDNATKHNALNDAIYQAENLLDFLNEYKLWEE